MATKIGRSKSKKNVTTMSNEDLIYTATKASYKRDQAKAKYELERRGVEWNTEKEQNSQ